ncbi:hypothetical protein FB45DRAFT_1053755 [Roridomyces roridus]|uniref:Uncharacterized protein n=1 Tax=Roridomyces roridus TaxID=1738132 RepID=A0AAD7FVZ4_9AGAR|nr:hypothetical protein FB45DRAFT_1053755 [Roridomyces roridus]
MADTFVPDPATATDTRPSIPAIQPPWIGMLSQTKDTPSCTHGICQLCRCETDRFTSHHLFPRVAVRNAAIQGTPFTPQQQKSVADLCWPCHCIVHRLIPHEVLACAFYTVDFLHGHGGVQAWLRWKQNKSILYLHSLMLPVSSLPATPANSKLVENISEALDAIWAEHNGDFPRWEGKGKKTRGHALRQQIRTLLGKPTGVNKPKIEMAMRANPIYREWQQRVFSERQQKKK